MKTTMQLLRSTALCAGLLSGLLLSQAAFSAEMEDTITVASPAFEHHGTVPLANTAYGDNTVPALTWSNLPEGTVQLALVMDDPVAPTPEPFVHWVAYNIPAGAAGIPAGLTKDAVVSGAASLEGMINGVNGIRQTGYFGPRPPVDGKLHAYHFRIYALDTALNLPEGLNKQQLLEAIDGHVLGTGMLMGHYEQK